MSCKYSHYLKVRIRANSLPWITQKIKEQMNSRDFYKKQAVKYNSQIHWTDWSKWYKDSVIIRINAAALIKFLVLEVRRLFEGGVYSRVAFIRGRRLFE